MSATDHLRRRLNDAEHYRDVAVAERDDLVAERDHLTREVARLREALETSYGALRVNEKAWQKLSLTDGNAGLAAVATGVALEVAREALREPATNETSGPES